MFPRLAFLKTLLKYADLLPALLDCLRRFAASEGYGAKAIALSDLLAILAPVLEELLTTPHALTAAAAGDAQAEQECIQQLAALMPTAEGEAVVSMSWLTLLLEILPVLLDLLRKARG